MATNYITTEGSDFVTTEASDFLVTEDSGTVPTGPVPVVQSVTPINGPQTGGTNIVILGQYFAGATSITIGGNAVTNVTIVSTSSPQQIICTTPAGTVGSQPIVVTNTYGSSNANVTFTYLAVSNCLPIGNFITGFTLNPVNNTNTNITSGYTYATPILLSVNTALGVSPANILNEFSLFADFGNGTEIEITQVTSSALLTQPVVYDWPGVYEVKLVVLPKNGCPVGTYSKTFSAVNYIDDNLNWDYSRWPELTEQHVSLGAAFHGFQSCPPGLLLSAIPLTFDFNVSNQLSSGIVFDLYSENSLSQPWETVTPDNKFAQLRPRWRFTDLNGNVVTSITATNVTPVYILPDGTRTNSNNGTLVGYTGTVDFYYTDDIPSLVYDNGFVDPVVLPTLWVVYNTTNISNLQDSNDGNAPSNSNSNVALSSYFYVKNLSADHFDITVDGYTIPLPNTVWPDTDRTFIITVNSAILSSSTTDFSNVALLNYPLIGANYSNVTAAVSPSAAATVYTPVFKFNRYDSLGRDTGGFFKNMLSTLPQSAVAALFASPSVPTVLTLSAHNFTTIMEPSAYNGYYSAANAYNGATTQNVLLSTSLTGRYSFNVTDFYQKYFVRKVNENFNYGALLQSYALQDFIANKTNFIEYLSAVGGDNVHPTENFGTVAYEKTANFVANNEDPSVAGVNQLYSLASMVDTEFDNYNYDLPPVLQRQFDLYSVGHEQLWGTREKYNQNFDNSSNHTNLGAQLTAYNINTTIVSAGQLIVLNDIFNSQFYELVEVPAITSYASITANNMQTHFPVASSLTFPLTAYPLSAFYGWGVNTPVSSYYRFFVYNNVYTNTPVNNLIDWNQTTDGSLHTTLSESVSSLSAWYADGGILENIYSFYLTKGLNLNSSKYYQTSGVLPQS